MKDAVVTSQCCFKASFSRSHLMRGNNCSRTEFCHETEWWASRVFRGISHSYNWFWGFEFFVSRL